MWRCDLSLRISSAYPVKPSGQSMALTLKGYRLCYHYITRGLQQRLYRQGLFVLNSAKALNQLTILCILYQNMPHLLPSVSLNSIIHLDLDQKHPSRSCTDIRELRGGELNKVIWYGGEKREKKKKNGQSKSFGLPAVLLSYVRVCACVTPLWTPKWKIHSPRERLYSMWRLMRVAEHMSNDVNSHLGSGGHYYHL